MYELTQSRRDESMGRRKTRPIYAWAFIRGRYRRIEPVGVWPLTPSRTAIKKNANAKRRRRDKQIDDF